MLRTLVSILFAALLFPVVGEAQKPKVKNLAKFDQRLYHFGFSLAYNRAGVYMDQRPRTPSRDSLQSITSIDQPGFNLGIISALHFNKNWSLRFLPALSFQDRVFQYRFLQPDSSVEVIDKRVGSTFIDIPLNIKFRSNRVNNFAAYVIGGAKYSIDMASNENVSNEAAEKVVLKFDQHDFAGQAGVGFDFFLQYFKFGIELKLSAGLKDLLIHENTRYAAPIQSVRSRLYLLSFTFEG